MINYDYCDTLESAGCEAHVRNYMINDLGFSVKLADQLITNSSEKNLPAGLKTQSLRNQSSFEIMMFKGNYINNNILIENIN